MSDEKTINEFMHGTEGLLRLGATWAKESNPAAFDEVLRAIRGGALRPVMMLDFESPQVARMVLLDQDGTEVAEMWRYAVRPLGRMEVN